MCRGWGWHSIIYFDASVCGHFISSSSWWRLLHANKLPSSPCFCIKQTVQQRFAWCGWGLMMAVVDVGWVGYETWCSPNLSRTGATTSAYTHSQCAPGVPVVARCLPESCCYGGRHLTTSCVQEVPVETCKRTQTKMWTLGRIRWA